MDCVAKVDFANTGKSVKLGMFPSSDVIVTEINGTVESVKEYYAIGKVFNMGYGHRDRNGKIQEDHLMEVTNVFVLKNCELTDEFCNWLGLKYGWEWKEHFCKEEYEKFLPTTIWRD